MKKEPVDLEKVVLPHEIIHRKSVAQLS
jgi:hypothetical protein